MKRLIVKVLVFFIPLVGLLFLLEGYTRKIPNSYKYKSDWMDNNHRSVEVLILGNSHLYCGFLPSMKNNTFNLANVAQNTEYDYWLLSKYIKDSPNLKIVVMALDYHNLFAEEYEHNSANSWNRAIYYNLYMGYPKHGKFSKYHYEVACPTFMISKVVKYSISKLTGRPYTIDCDSLGFSTVKKNGVLNANPNMILSRLMRFNQDDAPKRIRANGFYIEEMIKLCQRNGVKICFVSTPFHYLFNNVLEEWRTDMLNTYADMIVRKYHVNYFDFRCDTEFVKNPEYFKDFDHISLLGAEKLTSTIIEKLRLN